MTGSDMTARRALVEPLLVIGAGKMGGAILTAWLEADDDAVSVAPEKVYVEDPGPPPEMVDLLSKFDITASAKADLPETPKLVMVGVKPQVMPAVLEGLAPRLGPDSLVLSIAAGKQIKDIEKDLPPGTAIVRAMPNTPVLVQAGMTVLIANKAVTAQQKEMLTALFSATGHAAWVEDESLMDAVTAVSGSGPAYVFYLAECLAKAGEAEGLPAELALTLAKNTIYGAGALMTGSEALPGDLRVNVTSKGGTTAAALDVLMADDGIAPIVQKAITAAATRSKDLSG
ncbi:MAG: pyrroline-5-carboxylate reductase [Rhodomicrobium sp.]|nr:MAG: pyrroline-5-carboxylate reductase [Rhodomicrobium sp.]